MEVSDDDDHVFLVCTNPDDPIDETTETLNQEILVSTTDLLVWDSPAILSFQTIKVQAHRSRLIEQSLYFRGLLSGSFSESCLGSITISWNVRVFMQILKHMYGVSLDIAMDNIIPLYEGALYFGVETLLLKCETWLSEVFSPKGFQSTQIQIEDLIETWKFGLEHGSEFILNLCVGYLARNFMWAMHSNSFRKIPYDLLLSSVKHSHLTVDSEMHLSDALLFWLESNMESLDRPCENEGNCSGILKQVSLYASLLMLRP